MQVELLEIQVRRQAGLGSGSSAAVITGLRLEEFGEVRLLIAKGGVKANAGLRTDYGVVDVAYHAGLNGGHFRMFCFSGLTFSNSFFRVAWRRIRLARQRNRQRCGQ